ncbi:ComF family protein [Nakamurella sp. YIM 132087]|uniref:ComF family protein n=1 Tax=Nakamurella alba TaxID=2665158 RepID=A0A7K1FFT0_9ACTN|nr:ComF family protein [Nakamurella alba]MTD12971.1 ComF family protein [Nakamurella alba]
MGMLGLLAEAVDLVLPRTCPGCDAGVPWCAACAATLTVPLRRVRLGEEALDALAGLPAPPVRALARYAGPVRAAVIAGKERDRRDLPPLLGAAMGEALVTLLRVDPPPGPLVLVPAPSRRAAARRRGGDPVAAMARSAARVVAAHGRPVTVSRCLWTSARALDSVGLRPRERITNLRGRVRLSVAALPPSGATVVVLDDVVTSGATTVCVVEALAAVGIGVHGVVAMASAMPWSSV